ncbi:MAG: histidine phosphatase family protein, partial [Bacteroidetes bacterium]|nr:histidine phosphatase family protein [Bacteroidota bacterium]
MKTLLLIRHAKSSWDDLAMSDFERPLNDRGKRDAPMMARRLTDKKIAIDFFVSSPAKRAKKTAIFFAKEYGVEENDIVFKTELYAAPKDVFYEVIEKLDNSSSHVALFSHNPGITDFANSLTNVRADDMPTCA